MCSRILLVEDEEHKIADLTKRLQASEMAAAELHVARSVRDAVNAIIKDEFDLVILDMALPTFTKERLSGETGGVAQAAGGVEVIRMMQQLSRVCPVVIVTQYPDIYISGELIRLRKIRDTLRRKYGCDILGVVLYAYDSQEWEQSFDCLLGAYR